MTHFSNKSGRSGRFRRESGHSHKNHITPKYIKNQNKEADFRKGSGCLDFHNIVGFGLL